MTTSRGTIELHLSGELDVLSAGHLRQLTNEAMMKVNVRRLVVDLSGLTFIDLKGAESLEDMSQTARREGLDFQIRHHSPAVERLAQLLHVPEDEVLGQTASG